MKVTLKQTGKADRVLTGHDGQTLLSLLANEGIYLDAPCAGRGQCGKCRVKVSGGVSPAENKEVEALKGDLERRLACQARLTGEAALEIGAEARFSSVKGLGEAEPYEPRSPLKLVHLEQPDRQDGVDLMTRHRIEAASVAVLNDLACLDVARLSGWGLKWGGELLRVYPEGQKPEEIIAAAVDLGTTGLAAALIDVGRGEVEAQASSLNPQTSCGGDVISRITLAAGGPEQQAHLQKLIVDGLSLLLREVAGCRPMDRIMSLAISGNTTMIYLLAGIQPKGLAQAPYRPVVTRSLDLSFLACDLGLDRGAKIFTAPNISAYVGGDISAGILASGLKHRPGTVLFIDIGTNGELVVSHQGRLVATSCAAGPALEGMNIIRGQRATPGAVDSFSMAEDYSFKFTTIGEARPTGICGSGLIDICAALVARGLIDKSGRLKRPAQAPVASAWLKGLEEGRFILTDDVFLDQKDVRQVQLAKGAIAAGIEMLLDQSGLSVTDLDEIIIAGAFGFHLRPESLKAISLIPPDYDGPVRFVGNSSLAGAARMLLTPSALEELAALASETTVLELGFDPRFQTVFLKHLGF